METDYLLLHALRDVDRKLAHVVGNHAAVRVLEGEVCAVRKQTGRVAEGEQRPTELVASLWAEELSASKKMLSHRQCSEFRPNFSDVLAEKGFAFLPRDRMMS